MTAALRNYEQRRMAMARSARGQHTRLESIVCVEAGAERATGIVIQHTKPNFSAPWEVEISREGIVYPTIRAAIRAFEASE